MLEVLSHIIENHDSRMMHAAFFVTHSAGAAVFLALLVLSVLAMKHHGHVVAGSYDGPR